MKNKQNEILSMLRAQAEKIISGHQQKKGSDKDVELNEIFHELQVYQVELEMQNDELSISQEIIERERQRFAGLFNLAPVGYFILNNVTVIEQCNDVAVTLLAGNRREITNKRFQNFIIATDADTFYHFIKALQKSLTRQNCQLIMRNAHDKLFHAQIEGIAITDPLNRSISYYLAVIDITEKRTAELNQKEIQERLELALSASHTGSLSIYLMTGDIILDNFSIAILGLNNTYFDGKYNTLLDLILPDDRILFDKSLRNAVITNAELNIEFRIITADNKLKFIEAIGHVKTNHNGDFFTGILIDISSKKMLQEEAADLRENEQKNILKAIVDTQEKERIRISNSLHDGVGQLLYAIQLNLNNDRNLPSETLLTTKQLIQQAIKDIRNIAFELAPSILSDHGLVVAITETINRISHPQLTIEKKIYGFEHRMEASIEIFAFRVIQELLNNIIKHARATKVKVELSYIANELLIKITDNGIGFDFKNKVTSGLGISSVENRVKLYNGSFKINSKPGKGTEAVIILRI